MAKPFLFDAVNFLYHKVMDQAPKALQERSMGSAFVLGSIGNYLLVDGIQVFSKFFMSKNFNVYTLPTLEEICVVGTIVIPLIYSFNKPKEMEEIIKTHPTYSYGMLGAGLGAITSVFTGIENLI